MLSIVSPTRASSYSEGSVGTSSANPVTLAPSDCNHSASHAPLKPVWPVSSTRRSRQKLASRTPAGAGSAALMGVPGDAHRVLGPRSQGRRTGTPQLLELVAVAQRVHRLPEALVTVGRELALRGERAHRLLLPHGAVAIEVAVDPGREHEEATVGPAAVAAGLLLELAHQLAFQLQRTKTAGWLHGGDGCLGAAPAVEIDQRGQVHVSEPVAVGEAELLPTDVWQHALEPPAGHRLLACVHERHVPRLRFGAVHLHGALRQIERHVARVHVVVGEVLLDHVALVAETDHEVLDPVRGVHLHDVPQHRLAADLDHRLWTHRGLLAQSRAEATSQDHSLHSSAG